MPIYSRGGFSHSGKLSCHGFKLGISSEQDARTTKTSPLFTLRFKCRKAY